MANEATSFPTMPHSHVVGETALSAFKFSRPQEWVITESRADYGWDLMIEISEAGKMKGLVFFAQLKGTDNPDFVDGGTTISHPLRVSTVNFLLARAQPPMIAICHTSNEAQPVYWVWLKDAVDIIKANNSQWHEQESVSIRVPLSNLLKRTNTDVACYVRGQHDKLRVAQTVSEVLGIGVNPYDSARLETYTGEPERYVKELVMPNLRSAGLIDIFETDKGENSEPLSQDDQSRFLKLSEIGKLLTSLRDKEAEKLLHEIGSGIENASDGIRARYWNCLGILALHLWNDEEALSSFQKAGALRPYEPRFLTNYLSLQFHYRKQAANGKPILMETDWLTKLDRVLEHNPEFTPAIRLKAFWLAETEGAKGCRSISKYYKSLARR